MTCDHQSPPPSQPSATSQNSTLVAYAAKLLDSGLALRWWIYSDGTATRTGSGSQAPKPCSRGTCERF